MKSSWHIFLTLTLLCLLTSMLAGGVCSAEEKRIMIAVTGDTQGEIAPCG
ncbi:MAG: hypothetical protein PVF95_09465 [bacterium]|jgi:hypothetical protein